LAVLNFCTDVALIWLHHSTGLATCF